MTHPSKRKGNRFERELVNEALSHGLYAKRAYGSNGESLGFDEDVDLIIEHFKIQAKRRKSIAKYLQIPNSCDAVVFREDSGQAKVLMPFDELLELLAYLPQPSGG